MNPLTASLDDAAVDYAHQPGESSVEDAFRAGVEWGVKNTDWRVVSGSVPGWVFAGRVRLGDLVFLSGVEGRVVDLVGEQGRVTFTVETDAGKRIKYQRPEMEAVRVLDVRRSG